MTTRGTVWTKAVAYYKLFGRDGTPQRPRKYLDLATLWTIFRVFGNSWPLPRRSLARPTCGHSVLLYFIYVPHDQQLNQLSTRRMSRTGSCQMCRIHTSNQTVDLGHGAHNMTGSQPYATCMSPLPVLPRVVPTIPRRATLMSPSTYLPLQQGKPWPPPHIKL